MNTPTPAGWYPDPYNAAQLRYWDGAVWTDSVAPAGGQGGADATQQLASNPTTTMPTAYPPAANPSDSAVGGGPPNQQPATGGHVSDPGGWVDAAPAGTTDQWAAPTGPPSLDSMPGAAPGYPAWSGGGVGAQPPTGAGFGELGDWLSSIFRGLTERIGPVSVLLFLIPAITAAVTAVLGQRLLSDLVLDLEPDSDLEFEIAGFNGGLFALLVVISIVGAILTLVGRLGANHQLYAAHGGAPQSLGASLRTGLRRLPRAILWGLVLVVVLVIVVAVFALMLTIVLALSIGEGNGDASPLFALLVVPIMVLALVFGAWLWTKLAFFVPALAVGPAGTNPFSASWAMSRGRFWPVFGRLLLVAIALWILWGIFNAVFQPIFGSAASDLFQLDVVTGDVFIDGQNVETLDEIRWADVVPGPEWFGVVAVLYTLGRAVIDAIWTSSVTSLYWRGGGRGET